jgi:hypothetical protein
MREKRLSFMKEHPEKTAWRQSNMSYPEKCFQDIIKENNLDKKYLIYREYSVFPYFIDFAFINVVLNNIIAKFRQIPEIHIPKIDCNFKMQLNLYFQIFILFLIPLY